MKRISGIYCFENIENGNKYIGQAVNLDGRIKSHLRDLKKNKDDSIILQNAWNKYGKDNFVWYIVIFCPEKDLDAAEIFYIKDWHTHVSEGGYNIAWGGTSGMRGRHHSEETKRKMSEDRLGHIVSEETRAKLAISNKDARPPARSGFHISEELKRRYSMLYTGTHRSEEDKRKISEGQLGTHRTEEAKRNMSAAQQKRWDNGAVVSEETRRKISESKTGKKNKKERMPVSEEGKRNMSIAQKKRWENGAVVSEETKKKMSESAKLWRQKKKESGKDIDKG